MKHFCKYAVLTLFVAFGISTIASADPQGPIPCNNPGCKTASAPEVDPALAISGLTLLAGSLTVMRMRRKK
jgi:hypothetical protein